jgi:hypothetical protein
MRVIDKRIEVVSIFMELIGGEPGKKICGKNFYLFNISYIDILPPPLNICLSCFLRNNFD